ncbi:MAG: BlaI/MecI/CopY family transcriptional regulator [Planctomycetaceae bacterium]|nr:BlaI/MecI/CopY family transcriptional regulator [Planctomycetaceae bacterium]
MARPGSEHPTKLELEILKILWDESPLPVREVRAKLETEANRPLAHSSVITTLNIMYDKGLLRRRKEGKSFLFSPKVEKEQIAGGIMGDLLSRLFDGSASALMLNLLETTDVNSRELAELRKLITRKAKEQSQ